MREPRERFHTQLLAVCMAMAVGLAACTEGGSLWSSLGDDGGPPPPPPAAVAKVVIEPGAVLLSEANQVRALAARVYAADGSNITGRTVSWSSSAPANLSISQSGELRAEVSNGSTQITATVDGVRSRPILALVAQLAAGAVVVQDSEVSGDVRETETNGPPGTAGNSLEFTLTGGVPPPALGTVIVGSGEKPVAGRVVEVVTAGGQTVVRFVPGSMSDVFPEFVIDEEFQLGPDDMEVNPDLAANYDIVREGSRIEFRPKASALAEGASAWSGKTQWLPSRATVVGTAAVPPFGECELDGPSLDRVPLSLSLPPAFSFDYAPRVEIVRGSSNGVDRWLVTGPAEFSVEAGLGIEIAFEGSVTCKAELVTLSVPIGGPISVFIGGVIPVGVGFKLSGEVTVAQLEAKTKLGSKANLVLGLQCPEAEPCSIVRELTDSEFQLEPELTLPGGSTGVDQLRLALGAQFFGYAEVQFGSRLFRRLRLGALDAKAGAGLEGEFAPRFTQVSDTSFKANYGGKGFVAVEAGTELGQLAERLGLEEISFLELNLEYPFAASPTGNVRTDRADLLIGEDVSFEVRFDQPTLEFVPAVGPFNLREVVLVRRVPGGVEEIARLPGVDGDDIYTFNVVAPATGAADDYFAFVVTTLAPFDFFALEVDKATVVDVEVTPAAATVAPGGQVDFDATVSGLADTSVTWGLPDGGGVMDGYGVFTAGTSTGTYRVVATSVADPEVAGEAIVTVADDGGGGPGPISARVNAGTLQARAQVDRNCQPTPGLDREPDSGFSTGSGSLTVTATVPTGDSSSVAVQVTDFDPLDPNGPSGTGLTVATSDQFTTPCTSGSIVGTGTQTFWSFSVGGTSAVQYSVEAELSPGSQSDIVLQTESSSGPPVYYSKSTTTEIGSPSGLLAPGTYQVRIQAGDTLGLDEIVGNTFSHQSRFTISFSVPQ